MENISLKNLSAEQRAELLKELEAETKLKEANFKKNKVAYVQLKDVTVKKVFERLQKISSELQDSKVDLIKEFSALLESKNELFGVNEKQLSHNWANNDASITIVTGYNTIDRWDETVSVGITKVDEWLDNKTDEKSKNFVALIRDLLKQNSEGILKANRVLDLQNQADKIGDKELIEAVKLIREAHRPDRTGTYIKAKYKDDQGISHWLGLSMSSV